MMFNVSKCKVMHLGYKNNGYSYYMDGKVLDTVEQEKDLGILITKDLASLWEGKSDVGAINRTVEYKDKHILLNLYRLNHWLDLI